MQEVQGYIEEQEREQTNINTSLYELRTSLFLLNTFHFRSFLGEPLHSSRAAQLVMMAEDDGKQKKIF
jgi:hypothetical protein